LQRVPELECEQINNDSKTATTVITRTHLLYIYIDDYISVYADHAMDRLLTDHTFCNWSSIVDIYALILNWSETTAPIG